MIKASEAVAIVRTRLSTGRFQHCLNVAQVARELAEIYGVNQEQAYLTGILHDYAKDLQDDDLLLIAEEHSLIENEIERQAPNLLHAPVGAYLLAQEIGLKDGEILEAVRVHTLGSLSMSPLDKIIFLADMIEPSRDMYPDLERLRQLSRYDLDQAMLLGLESTIHYCLDRQVVLHPRTVAVRNIFLQKVRI
jgi:predicted HD superfamily hydrolase involved in NAD metabolism